MECVNKAYITCRFQGYLSRLFDRNNDAGEPSIVYVISIIFYSP